MEQNYENPQFLRTETWARDLANTEQECYLQNQNVKYTSANIKPVYNMYEYNERIERSCYKRIREEKIEKTKILTRRKANYY
jgi:hypothetical protein